MADATEAGPGEVGQLLGEAIGVEVGAGGYETARGALGQPDDGEGERALMLRVDVGLDHRRDRRRHRLFNLADRLGELLIAARTAAEHEGEHVVVLSHPPEIGLKALLHLGVRRVHSGGRRLDLVHQPAADRGSSSR